MIKQKCSTDKPAARLSTKLLKTLEGNFASISKEFGASKSGIGISVSRNGSISGITEVPGMCLFASRVVLAHFNVPEEDLSLYIVQLDPTMYGRLLQ